MFGQEVKDWLRLSLIPEVGSRRGIKLLEKFKTPGAILKARLSEIREVENIGNEVAKKIVENRDKIDLDKQLKLIDKNKAEVIPLNSQNYPAQLKAIFDPPLVLFVKGKILPDDYFSIAIVGTRLASVYGRNISEKISAQLAERGLTVVSGGARGIDTSAHRAALRALGRTIAVLGSGVDVNYPLENGKLFDEVSKNGAVISEFPMGTEPNRINFPMRNRIISGLSLGVVVIEAPIKSGALITVKHALEQGREIFSVPGEANKFNSQGTNQLIREGAKLVENADDIIEELKDVIYGKLKEKNKEKIQASEEKSILPGTGLDKEEEEVYGLVGRENTHIDEIAGRSGLNAAKVLGILTRLELKKLIRELPGKVFVRP
ncbi:MAG: DNA-processing protein DprA [Candidatus Omnitrophota bacterium]|nr:DNA-processing protein DprA [Candidatus Omnitrophota bacterium]